MSSRGSRAHSAKTVFFFCLFVSLALMLLPNKCLKIKQYSPQQTYRRYVASCCKHCNKSLRQSNNAKHIIVKPHSSPVPHNPLGDIPEIISVSFQTSYLSFRVVIYSQSFSCQFFQAAPPRLFPF